MQKTEPKSTELDQLKSLLDSLNQLLPTQIKFTSASKPISKAQVLKGACAHRIYELSSSVYTCLGRGEMISAIVLFRAIMETESLFLAAHKLMAKAVSTKDTKDLTKFLTNALTGTRLPDLQKTYGLPDAINCLTLIQKTAKNVSHYDDHYTRLCEFVHPNGLGIRTPYVKIDHRKMTAIYSKSSQNVPESIVLPLLIGTIKLFINTHDQFEHALESLIPIYEEQICDT
ncbi:MAG: hypothetical protein JSR37_08530 [Verrucomicrobia bacterium]|nr:hypothetical protein [Verrucomicrobiota bacterium]MBS0636726.1 hypothetical protein [Verrucomicrobiota bacterium]